MVVKVRSAQNFDVRINGKTYNVYTGGRGPRGISVGDVVRINGVRLYSNDIRNASVSITRHR